ncbi:uncharacterized protein F5Z01DRAFT_497007 [Emericellopsis atlantica]|uniref:Uncharacterized protein n=1 Tax=Emericellopsis atlantica TaxID=2614577 RepID=A0A9P8CRC1_9HYPO|nr:uncharacterized protein F5Z01DRAFT_497007 [Emericellopsis atlantica]KAG9256182.1 hypothetical protein F5Z01DRAFT_497007 [Emericellopsis atlantica]
MSDEQSDTDRWVEGGGCAPGRQWLAAPYLGAWAHAAIGKCSDGRQASAHDRDSTQTQRSCTTFCMRPGAINARRSMPHTLDAAHVLMLLCAIIVRTHRSFGHPNDTGTAIIHAAARSCFPCFAMQVSPTRLDNLAGKPGESGDPQLRLFLRLRAAGVKLLKHGLDFLVCGVMMSSTENDVEVLFFSLRASATVVYMYLAPSRRMLFNDLLSR